MSRDRTPDRTGQQATASDHAQVTQIAGDQHNTYLGPGSDRRSPRTVGRRTAMLAITLAAVLTAASVVMIDAMTRSTGHSPVAAPSNPSPIPAPSASPPVLVENVTDIRGNLPGGDFALPQKLSMTPAQLGAFGINVVPGSAAFSTWYAEHRGAAVGFGLLNMTLRGNAAETIQITDMEIAKQCRPPLDGTYFKGYSQGTGDTVKVGFDLDSPEPIAQEMAQTSGRGLYPLGNDFFSAQTNFLRPGETETLSIGVFTKKYDCDFTFRLIVATSHGSFFEDIDHLGKPFEVTAVARPGRSGLPLSGYRAAYAEDANGWKQIDPMTYQEK